MSDNNNSISSCRTPSGHNMFIDLSNYFKTLAELLAVLPALQRLTKIFNQVHFPPASR